MIIGERLQLRAIEEADLPLLAGWRNHPEVAPYFCHSEPLSLEQQRRWFDRFLSRDDERLWIAEQRDDATPVGSVGLTGLDWRHRRAELARVVVAPDHRGQGYSREMCRLAIGFAFDELNLHRLSLEVIAGNEPALTLYRGLGFQEEGRLREHVFRAGGNCDVLIFGLLRAEWRVES